MTEPKTIEEIKAWNSAIEAVRRHVYKGRQFYTYFTSGLYVVADPVSDLDSLKKPLPSPERGKGLNENPVVKVELLSTGDVIFPSRLIVTFEDGMKIDAKRVANIEVSGHSFRPVGSALFDGCNLKFSEEEIAAFHEAEKPNGGRWCSMSEVQNFEELTRRYGKWREAEKPPFGREAYCKTFTFNTAGEHRWPDCAAPEPGATRCSFCITNCPKPHEHCWQFVVQYSYPYKCYRCSCGATRTSESLREP